MSLLLIIATFCKNDINCEYNIINCMVVADSKIQTKAHTAYNLQECLDKELKSK